MPPGTHFDNTGQLAGSAYATGTYQFTITALDSWTTPETATEQFTITVFAPSLSIARSLPNKVLLNRPFSGRLIAIGGTPPYQFAIASGSLPTGLTLDPTGVVSGTPTVANQNASAQLQATDSSQPSKIASSFLNLSVNSPMGRNDTPATATVLPVNGSTVSFQGSISPYIDPPNGAPFAGDGDYYKLSALGGSTVHAETFAKRNNQNNPLDTVIEIVDGNGIQLNTCHQPGAQGSTFTSACINDDMSATPHVQDSALDYQVPGAPPSSGTFYVHVLDWRGDARPDMTYSLNVSGLTQLLSITTTTLSGATTGISYGSRILSSGGIDPITWSVTAGALPPGLSMDSNGFISGTATTPGTYSFTVQATDNGTQKQTVTGQLQIQVADRLVFTSPSTWPDACVNQPYSFTLTTMGGLLPLRYAVLSSPWPLSLSDPANPVFSGTPTAVGTFGGLISVIDANNLNYFQSVTLTVKQCP
jgi:hypothetical protein